MSVSLTIKRDSRALQKLRQRMRYLDGTQADVGYFADKRYGTSGRDRDGLPVASIAYANNNGVKVTDGPVIPSRPFFTLAVMRMQKTFVRDAGIIVKAAMRGDRTWVQQLNLYLNKYKEQIQSEILAMSTPRNANKTIAMKGFDDPLIDTGLMYDSVATRIKRG